MRKSMPDAGFLIQDDYPPGSSTAPGQTVVLPVAPSRSEQIANKLNWLAFALLVLSVVSPVILLWMWVYVDNYQLNQFNPHRYDIGFIGSEIVSQGVSGLYTLWYWAMLCPAGAIVASLFSLVYKTNWRAIVIIILGLVWGGIFLALNTQYAEVLFKLSWVAA